VTAVRFRRERLEAEILDPRHGFERRRLPLEVRWDPLTGRSCRLLPRGSLPPPVRLDLEGMAERSRPDCPFCPERVEEVTPRFPPEVCSAGRFRHGAAILFPNLVPYAKWSSVSIYAAARHRIALAELDPQAIADNLQTQADFARAVRAYDPASVWVSVNANQMPPSGSSVFHPHLQGSVNPTPTTTQALLAALPAAHVRAYLAAELAAGERHLGSTGRLDWLASFAPGGQAEVLAFDFDARDAGDLDGATIAEYADGISRVLATYAELGFESFNLAIYGPPVQQRERRPRIVRLVARSTIGPLERSDVMWSERLHDEAVVDLAPEAFAEHARRHFVR